MTLSGGKLVMKWVRLDSCQETIYNYSRRLHLKHQETVCKHSGRLHLKRRSSLTSKSVYRGSDLQSLLSHLFWHLLCWNAKQSVCVPTRQKIYTIAFFIEVVGSLRKSVHILLVKRVNNSTQCNLATGAWGGTNEHFWKGRWRASNTEPPCT